MRYSVIIPTLNEAGVIEQCIDHVRRLGPEAEIIVADGGSQDGTVEIARRQGVKLALSERGRGVQCNAGSAIATGDILIFLHADTELPEDAFAQIDRCFRDDSAQIGTFKLSFIEKHWLLWLYCLAVRLDLPFTRFGDQCIVVRRPFLESLGGFPNWRLFEDLGLINEARKRTRIHRFPGTVRTSARRFLENGIVRQQMLNMWYTALYFLGVSPDELASRYERRRRGSRDAALVVFARFPRTGKVKTRLAKVLGAERATEFYRSCAEHVLAECGDLDSEARLYVAFPDRKDVMDVRRWVGTEFDLFPQRGPDLGERLINAVKKVFDRGARRAMVMASDVPDISARLLRDALVALDDHDVVIGPCFDGGYYLIGMKELSPDLFRGISWSTQHVLDQTLAVAAKLGLSVHQLPRLYDIDTEEDMDRWMRAQGADTVLISGGRGRAGAVEEKRGGVLR